MISRRLGADRERGSLAPAIAIMASMFLALAGLVIDSSRHLNARARAVSYAQEAARAGAQGIRPQEYQVELDPGVAAQRVGEYCAEVRQVEPEMRCQLVSVTGGRVVAEASVTIQTGLLGLVNIQTLTASGQGEATACQGVTTAQIRCGDDDA